MAGAVTDKLRKGYQAFSTTLASTKASGATTMSLSSATGIPTTTGIDFTVGRVDSSGNSTPSTKVVYTGTLSGTTVSNLTVKEGSDQSHSAGTVVEITFTASMWNDHVDHHLAEHNQDGTHGDITTTSINNAGALTQTDVATFSSNIDVNDSSTAVRDSSDNELVKFAKTASAVNEVTVANAATGNAPQLAATGDDTNIYLDQRGKGNASVLTQLPLKEHSTTTYPAGLLIQHGWDYAQGSSSANASGSITFPVAYSSAPVVFVHGIGSKSTSAPTAITQFNTATRMAPSTDTISTTGFNFNVINTDNTSWTTSQYLGISWIAIGVK